MLNAFTFLASVTTPPLQVPESGMTVALITGSILTLGLFARFMKKRKK